MKKLVIALALVSAASVSQAGTMCFNNEGKLAKIKFDEQSVRINWDVKDKSPQNIEDGGVTKISKNGSQVELVATFSGMSDVYDQVIRVGYKKISFQALWTNGTPAGEESVFDQVNCQ